MAPELAKPRRPGTPRNGKAQGGIRRGIDGHSASTLGSKKKSPARLPSYDTNSHHVGLSGRTAQNPTAGTGTWPSNGQNNPQPRGTTTRTVPTNRDPISLGPSAQRTGGKRSSGQSRQRGNRTRARRGNAIPVPRERQTSHQRSRYQRHQAIHQGTLQPQEIGKGRHTRPKPDGTKRKETGRGSFLAICMRTRSDRRLPEKQDQEGRTGRVLVLRNGCDANKNAPLSQVPRVQGGTEGDGEGGKRSGQEAAGEERRG